MTETANQSVPNMITWEQDGDGIVTLTMDDPTQGANTMNEVFTTSLTATVDRLVAEKDSVSGVILTSGKKMFFAGGDLSIFLHAGWRRWANQSSPPSTVPHSVADLSWRWRATTEWHLTHAVVKSACLK